MSCYPCRVVVLSCIRRTVRRGHLRLALGLSGAFIAMTLPACLIDLRPQSVGDITLVRGNVFLARAEMMHPEPVMQSYPIFAGDVIETQAQSSARIALPHAWLMLGPDTRLAFQQRTDEQRAIVSLERGTVRLKAASDTEDLWTVEILAGGSRTETHNAEITVWAQEDFEGREAAEPGAVAIRSVGVINHGSYGEATFQAMEGSVVVRPGYLSATTPDHPPVPAIAMEVAKPFVTDIVQSTNPEQNPNRTPAMAAPAPPPVKRVTETIAQRACKKQKDQTLRMKPSIDHTKTRLTHCL